MRALRRVFKLVGGGDGQDLCESVRIMAIKLRTLDGQELVVFPDRREILFRDRLYQNPRVYNGNHRMIHVGDDVFRQRWPEIATVTGKGGPATGVHFPLNDGLNINGRAFWSMHFTAHDATVQHVNIIARFVRRHIIWPRKLAVGMMTHARLGEACGLNRFPEVVKMVMEAL